MPEPDAAIFEQADFDAIYRGEPFIADTEVRLDRVPWDIGEPQPVVVELEAAGGFSGTVLDVGCGAGENALFLAERGHPVVGVDGSPTGLAQARERARVRGFEIEFVEDDATRLRTLAQRFDTVLDSALYHCLPDEKRADYAAALHRVTHPGAVLHLICFAHVSPETGAMAITQENLHANLDAYWEISGIERATYLTTLSQDLLAQLSSIPELAELGSAMYSAQLDSDSQGRVRMPMWQLRAQRR